MQTDNHMSHGTTTVDNHMGYGTTSADSQIYTHVVVALVPGFVAGFSPADKICGSEGTLSLTDINKPEETVNTFIVQTAVREWVCNIMW